MPAPTDSDLTYYLDGNPTNNTNPLGGSFSGSPVSEGGLNALIYKPVFSTSLNKYHGVASRKNTASGTLQSARLFNRTGGVKPATSGTFRASSSSGSDTGKLWVCFLSGAAWYTGELTLNGTSWVNALSIPDAATHWIAVYQPGIPAGDITIQIDSDTVGVINSDADGFGNSQANTLYRLAVATALDTPIGSADRLTAPSTGIGSFSDAALIPGTDNSIALPADLGANERIAYCVELTIPANCPRPFGGQIVCDIDLIGDPVP